LGSEDTTETAQLKMNIISTLIQQTLDSLENPSIPGTFPPLKRFISRVLGWDSLIPIGTAAFPQI